MLFPRWDIAFLEVHPISPISTLFHTLFLFARAICTMSLCRILPISLNCAMHVIPGQVAFEFAIKFSSGRSHQFTRVDVAGEAKDPPEGAYPPPLCISYARVQATGGVGTVIIVHVILIAYGM